MNWTTKPDGARILTLEPGDCALLPQGGTVVVHWDTQDPDNTGWASRVYDENHNEMASGALEAADADSAEVEIEGLVQTGLF